MTGDDVRSSDRREVARAALRTQHPNSSPGAMAANRQGRLHPDQRRSLLREGYGFGGILVGLGLADTAAVLLPFPFTTFTGVAALVGGAGPVALGVWVARWYRRRLDDPVEMVSGRLVGRRIDARTVHVSLGEHFVTAAEEAQGLHAELAIWHRRVVAATITDPPSDRPHDPPAAPGRAAPTG